MNASHAVSNGCSVASLVTLVGGVSALLEFAPKTWNGLGWILVGIPASIGVALILGVIGWARGEQAAPWVTALAAMPALLVLAILTEVVQ